MKNLLFQAMKINGVERLAHWCASENRYAHVSVDVFVAARKRGATVENIAAAAETAPAVWDEETETNAGDADKIVDALAR